VATILMILPQMVTEHHYQPGGGTTISDTGGGTPFRLNLTTG